MKVNTCILFVILLTGCNQEQGSKNTPPVKKPAPKIIPVEIKLVSLGKINNRVITTIFAELQKVVDSIDQLPAEKMPAAAYYAPRNRYRADTLIHWMSRRAGKNEVYLGITSQDISTTKGENPDSGIMGLGFNPGAACVASDFRLRNKKNFFKVVIHELGHTAGLPHCPVKTCFMRDAEGGDPTGEETGFCVDCKKYLISKGWRL